MELLLMVAAMSLLGLGVMGLAFGAATRPEQQPPAVQAKPDPVKAAVSARFFVQDPVLPLPEHARVPIEALLLQIENHVRLEHAAAESFLEYPTAALLHSRTISTLVQ